ncbi:MAG: glycosyltransferase [Bacteroidales bacterium]|nr:glycosyltransferase [Bacteroidales bacterium]
MDLSIVIVNYNVKYFLEQCLHSVFNAISTLEAEVFVVDNNSVDGSCTMVSEKFPLVKLICNSKNYGFAKANNQAIKKASGKYILLLNPDTVVEENTFVKCFHFMEKHSEAGSLGVKLIDGKGNFLPESKRSLPTPEVAFYKIFGLAALFPGSKKFGKYHLSYLDSLTLHEVEVLPGAFFWVRKQVLDTIGLLDEDFFMYGEDIDLSYRILKEGYKNFYFPETTIIHYKGESTKKGSVNYVLVFYNAMRIFARKHFSNKNARIFNLLINFAIFFRAGLSILRRVALNIITPVLDMGLMYSGFYLIAVAWARYKFHDSSAYPEEFLYFVVPAYILLWMGSIFFNGGYDRNLRTINLLKGIFSGGLIILLIYALLPETLRYSRAIILIGAFWVGFSTLGVRYLLSRLNPGNFSIKIKKVRKRIVVIGKLTESNRVISILKETQIIPEIIGIVDPGKEMKKSDYIGHISQINDIVKINKAEELVFCAKDISSQQIIKTMLDCTGTDLEFKIAPPESLSIIGSNSIDTAGELYTVNFNSVGIAINQRKKRVLDITLSILLLSISPVLIFFIQHPGRFFINLLKVFLGINSWVGYHRTNNTPDVDLPEIKKGILSPSDSVDKFTDSEELQIRMDLIYAKDYRMINDINIILKGFKHLGRKVL